MEDMSEKAIRVITFSGKKNSMAYNDLMLVMTKDVSFGLVDEAVSSTYPEGDARSAWGRLTQRYESQTNASRVKLMGQFTIFPLKFRILIPLVQLCTTIHIIYT